MPLLRAMQIELRNLRRAGATVVVDAKVHDGSASRSYPITLRVVGTTVQPSMTITLSRELMDQIFAAVREFSQKNHEKICGLFFGDDRTNQ